MEHPAVKTEEVQEERKKKRRRSDGATGREKKVEKVTNTPRGRKEKKRIPDESPRRKRKEFTLEDITSMICEDPPEAMDVRDEQLCATILQDMDRGMLEDMAAYFLRGEGILDDEKRCWGPPKWTYTKGDDYDSFDYYAATGCKPNSADHIWLSIFDHRCIIIACQAI